MDNDFSNIRGEPLPLDEFLTLAEIDELDIESAAQWFDEHATVDWIGALDAEPVDND